MTTVVLEKTVAEELIRYKLHSITEEIHHILGRWNETSASGFLEKARNGIIEEAENDAIDLHQLLADEKLLRDLLKKI
ncbi:MAG: hypothetical protein RBG13Loki_3624 [Promethearchaeota archaeon CR_4]|nr:MAG: hypothetical protein RBG13Loki_3624 [Candidatus Lokiarchaeota archaeon CR_4]